MGYFPAWDSQPILRLSCTFGNTKKACYNVAEKIAVGGVSGGRIRRQTAGSPRGRCDVPLTKLMTVALNDRTGSVGKSLTCAETAKHLEWHWWSEAHRCPAGIRYNQVLGASRGMALNNR